ncbi:MAG TPA: DUF3644 domain-containing protein [Acidimicrobiia bacterium]|nr:DUF3644 domain-containing protein [Acidimicrobiia bacterium]
MTERNEREHRKLAREMYDRWEAGEPKSRLEIEYWGNATSHGKAFSAYVRKWLDLETEHKSTQTERLESLESLLRIHGISPAEDEDLTEDYRLLARTRESALAALRIYNDPSAGFRTESFIVLMVIAWNALLQAILEREGVDYFERRDDGTLVEIDGRAKVLDTYELMNRAIGGKVNAAIRCNLDFFLQLRNVIAHRYLPAVDIAIVSEAQSLLLNLENKLVNVFGREARLGNRLVVPLQLSQFRTTEALRSIKNLQAQLPADVMDFLSRHRREVPDEVLRSPEYALPIFFVPVTANRERSAEAVVRFVRPGEVTEKLEDALQQIAVVTKPKRISVASHDLMRPGQVVELVSNRLPYRFTTDTHTRCWKHFNVRPASGSSEPDVTDDRYCVYDSLGRQYGYKHAWVELLVKELSNPEVYEAIVGFRPAHE